MNKPKLIFAALPYAHGPLHLGRIIGSLLPADILHRYYKQNKIESHYLTGADMHGEGVLCIARQSNRQPNQVSDTNCNSFIESMNHLRIQPCIFLKTNSVKHHSFVSEFLQNMKSRGLLNRTDGMQYYCKSCSIHLTCRSVITNCNYCESVITDDVCEKCWNPHIISSVDVAICKKCKKVVSIEIVQNYTFNIVDSTQMIDLVTSAVDQRYQKQLYSEDRTKPKSILRYIDYGIAWNRPTKSPVVYVWVQALLSYLEMESEIKDLGDQAERHFFIGKDNLFFHAEVLHSLYSAAGAIVDSRIHCRNYLLEGDKKISSTKSGSVPSVSNLIKEGYTSDSIRLFCCSRDPLFSDSAFRLEDLRAVHNSTYCGKMCNYLHRLRPLFLTDLKYTRTNLRVDAILEIFDVAVVKSNLTKCYKAVVDLADYSNLKLVEYMAEKNTENLVDSVCTFLELARICTPLTPVFSQMVSRVLVRRGGLIAPCWAELIRYNLIQNNSILKK